MQTHNLQIYRRNYFFFFLLIDSIKEQKITLLISWFCLGCVAKGVGGLGVTGFSYS